MFCTRLAIPALSAGLILAATAGAAHAQAARIEDIQVLVEDGRLQVLVRTSGQPTGASADLAGARLVVEIAGLDLAPFETRAAPGSAVSRVTAAAASPGVSRIEFAGAALSSVETVIYRNALMIEGRLAEPDLKGGESLLSKVAPVIQPAPVVSPEPPPAPPAPAMAISLVAPIAPPPASPPEVLEGAALPAASPGPGSCEALAARLVADAWDLTALGPRAICLIDDGKPEEARPLLERLAAFSPDDWRSEYGQGRLAHLAGDLSRAEIGYRNALVLASAEPDRALIRAQLAKLAAG